MRLLLTLFFITILSCFTLTAQYENEYEDYHPPLYNIQVGVWLPMSKLSNTFKASPYIGFKAGIPMNASKTYFLDFGLDAVFPNTTNEFYFDEDGGFYTKSKFIFDLGLQLRHEGQIANNIYLSKYVGIGFNTLYTNNSYSYTIEYCEECYDEFYDEFYDDCYYKDVSEYYKAFVFSCTVGVNLSYKNTGVFLEYNYAGYSSHKALQSSFGNSSLKAGLNYRF